MIAVAYTEQERQFLAGVIAQFTTDPSYWDDPSATRIRQRIKRHYITVQDRKCCYCRREFPTSNARVWDIDHIVPRTLRPQFMFVEQNLAACCVDCNIAKSSTNVFRSKAKLRYPTSPALYSIIHPHFERYDEHIDIFLGVVYRAKTPKGIRTIEVCKLLRHGMQPLNFDSDSITTSIQERIDQLTKCHEGAKQQLLLTELLILTQRRITG